MQTALIPFGLVKEEEGDSFQKRSGPQGGSLEELSPSRASVFPSTSWNPPGAPVSTEVTAGRPHVSSGRTRHKYLHQGPEPRRGPGVTPGPLPADGGHGRTGL